MDYPTSFKILTKFMENLEKADKQQKESGVYADYKICDAIREAQESLIEGENCNHNWVDCISSKKCKKCGLTEETK